MIRDTPDDVERDGVGRGRGRDHKEDSGPVVIDLTLSSSDEEDGGEDEPPLRPITIR